MISGYLITSIILSELKSGTFSIVHFYERRARRVLPALFLVIAISLPFVWLWLSPLQLKNFSASLVAVSTFSSNILFWITSGYFDSAAELKPLLHSWSLAVEEQYYLLFPIFLMLTWRLEKRRVIALLVVIFIVSLAMAQILVASRPDFAFFLLPTRGWELLIGAFIAFHLEENKISDNNQPIYQIGAAIGMFLIVYAIFIFDSKTPFPSLYTLMPTIGTGLLIICATESTYVGKFLGNKFFVSIGLISYSAYLWHQPLFALFRHRGFEPPNTDTYIYLIVLTMVLAYLSWRFIERPFRDKGRFDRKQVFFFSFIGSIFFISVGLIGYLSKGFPQREAFRSHKAFNYDTTILGYKICSEEIASGGDLNYCYQTNNGMINAVLVGDSHADDKFYGIEKNDLSHNWALLGNSSCPPVFGVNVEAEVKGCQEKFEKIFSYLEKHKEIKTVVLSYAHTYPLTPYAADHIAIMKERKWNTKILTSEISSSNKIEIFNYGISMAVKKLLASNKDVYVLMDIPELPYFPQDCLKGRPHCEVEVAEIIKRQDNNRKSLEKLKSDFPDVKIFDPTNIFCNEMVCSYKKDGIILYRDSHHLSIDGSDYYGKMFSKWLIQQKQPNSI